MKQNLLKTLSSFIVITHALYSSECVNFECNTQSSTQCMSVSGTTITLSPCPSNQSCDSTLTTLLSTVNNANFYRELSCKASTAPSSSCTGLGQLAHGQTCCNNGDCASDNCKDKCVGKPDGEGCLSDSACEAGSYCEAGVCTDITKSNGDNCTSHSQCPPGSGCNNSICTRLASLSTGSATESSRFCKSLLRNGNTCEEVVVKIEGQEIDYPYECEIGETCSYFYKSGGGFGQSIACPCNGKAGASKSHCIWVQGMQYDAYDNEWYQFDSSKCSGPSTNNISMDYEDCGHMSKGDAQDILELQAIHQYWPLYKSGSIDGCAQDLGLFDPDTDDEGGAEVLVIGALMALLCQL